MDTIKDVVENLFGVSLVLFFISGPIALSYWKDKNNNRDTEPWEKLVTRTALVSIGVVVISLIILLLLEKQNPT